VWSVLCQPVALSPRQTQPALVKEAGGVINEQGGIGLGMDRGSGEGIG
jgi:hypothetical protein